MDKLKKDYEVAMFRTPFVTNYETWIRKYVNQLENKLSRCKKKTNKEKIKRQLDREYLELY